MQSWRPDVAAALWHLGCSWQHIAFVLGGISRQRVFAILGKAGINDIATQKVRVTEAHIDEAIAAGHATQEAVCAYLKARGLRFSVTAVSDIMKARGYRRGVEPGPTGHLHCPGCGWQPAAAFSPRQAAQGKSGRLCRACNNARCKAYQEARRRVNGVPSRAAAAAETARRNRLLVAYAAVHGARATAEEFGLTLSTVRYIRAQAKRREKGTIL